MNEKKPLIFGDPANIHLIVDNYRNVPHIREKNIHECNCCYCTHEEEIRRCSVCKYEWGQDEFECIDDWHDKCPKCKKILMDPRAYDQMLQLKKKAYLPIENKNPWEKDEKSSST